MFCTVLNCFYFSNMFKLKHLAQEGTATMLTPCECHPNPIVVPLCHFFVLKGLGVGGWGQLCTAGGISGLTLDANANMGLGMEQPLSALWPLADTGLEK